MKNILITGASGDIGSAIARQLANENNRLILVYNHSKKEIDSLLDELMDRCELIAYKCDLTDDDLISAMVDDIIKKFKHIDCLINCAGVSIIKQIQDITISDYNFIFDNNVKSTIMLTKYISKYMINAQFGRIINISSIWGKVGASTESLYSASKGAVNSFTLALAKELGYDFSVVLGYPEYYSKSGYIPASRYGIKAPFIVDDKYFMALCLTNNPFPLNGVMKYDDAFNIE